MTQNETLNDALARADIEHEHRRAESLIERAYAPTTPRPQNEPAKGETETP